MNTEIGYEKSAFVDRFRSPRDVVAVLFKQKMKILTVFFLTTALVMAWVYTASPQYEATASLIIKFGREHIYRPEIGPNDPAPIFDSSDAVQSEMKILTSSNLAKRVVEAIGLEEAYPKLTKTSSEHMTPLEAATLIFRKNLSANQVKNSNVIDIVFTHSQPQIASQAVNHLVDFFMEKHLQVLSDPKAKFFEKQLRTYREELQGAEQHLQEFKQKYALSSPTKQQELLLQQRGKLDASLKHGQNQIAGLKSKGASIKRQIQSVPERVPLSSVTEQGEILAKAKADLLDLKRQELQLLSKYKETSHLVQSLRSQMDMVEEYIAQQENSIVAGTVTTGTNPIFEKLEGERFQTDSELNKLMASGAMIERQITSLDSRLQQFDKLDKELRLLERQVTTAQHNHDLYLTKFEEARISEEMNRLKMSNIRLVQSSEVPRVPVGLPKSIKLLLGVLAGAVAGLAVAFLSESVEGSYMKPDEAAQDLGLPVLVSINHKG